MPLKSGIRFSTPVLGVELVDRAHGLGVQPGAAVGQVVAGDAGDGGVAQPHRPHRLGDPARLVAVQRLGLAGVDLAEVAAPGALVAADEERRLAVLPALEDVGAAGLLAHRVQALGLHQVLERVVLRTHPRPGLDPLRLALDRGLGVADLEAQELAACRECELGSRRPTLRGEPSASESSGACQLVTNWLPFWCGRLRSPRRPGPPRRCSRSWRPGRPGWSTSPRAIRSRGRRSAGTCGCSPRPAWSTAADRGRERHYALDAVGAGAGAALLDRLGPASHRAADRAARSTPSTPRYAAPRATGVRRGRHAATRRQHEPTPTGRIDHDDDRPHLVLTRTFHALRSRTCGPR